jgi:hypothetical protein
MINRRVTTALNQCNAAGAAQELPGIKFNMIACLTNACLLPNTA